MVRKCLACGGPDPDTLPDWPAVCRACSDRVGDNVEPGCQVVCTVDHGCSGIVDRLEDDGTLVVVRTQSSHEAWVPIQEIVRVIGT